MHEKLVEILVILMDKIKRKGLGGGQMELLTGELQDQGYSQQEISTAFSFLIERAQDSSSVSAPDSRSFRVLNDVERIFISKEAYGYLLQLASLELISPGELEGIIDKALMVATPFLSIDDIKLLAAEVLFDIPGGIDFSGENLPPTDTVH